MVVFLKNAEFDGYYADFVDGISPVDIMMRVCQIAM